MVEFPDGLVDLSLSELVVLVRSDWPNQLPSDPDYYDSLVEEYWPNIGAKAEGQSSRKYTFDDNELRQRIVLILRELLSKESSCTIYALLRIAGKAYCWPNHYGPNGVNALSGVANAIDDGDIAGSKELLSMVRQFAQEPYLRHNAELFVERMLRLQPDLGEE